MNESDGFTLDCTTCIGTGTTACNDCIVTHLLANDDGPIDYVPVELAPVRRARSPQETAISLFRRAGMVGDVVEFVPLDEFESFGVPASV